MKNNIVTYIKNGSTLVPFVTFYCVYCGKELPECDPRKQLDNGENSCCACAFINGDMDESEYLKTACCWFSGNNKYAIIENGEIIVGCGKRRGSSRDKRNSPEYNKWRCTVFGRDNYTCRKCGVKGGEINAHHIKPYKSHKELRLDVNNGVTLCVTCHRGAHGAN